MAKGTPSFGRRNKKTHIRCRRCGKHAYHIRKKKCSACGFGTAGTAKLRRYKWQTKKGVTLNERRV
jgi:large subunit ribosomal protein L37e